MPIHSIEPRRLYRQIADQIRTLIRSREFPAGAQNLIWDGTSEAGTRASAGVYFVRVTVRGASVARRIALLR